MAVIKTPNQAKQKSNVTERALTPDTTALPGVDAKIRKQMAYPLTRTEQIFMLGLLLGASLLLFYNLGELDFWGDEVSSMRISAGSIRFTLTQVATDNKHPPFYFLLLNFWRGWAGASEYAVRFLSVVPALLAIAVTFRLGRLFSHRTIGLISAFILAVSPFFILFSRMTRYYSLSTLLTMLSLLLFLRILRGGGRRLWISYVIATILLIYTNYITFSVILCQNLVLLLQARRYRLLLKKWVIGQLVIFGAYLPWIVVGLNQVLYLSQNRWFFEAVEMVKRAILNVGYLYYAFSIGETITPWRFFITIPLLGAFTLTLLLGLRLFATADREKLLIILLVLTISIVLLMLVWTTIYGGLSFVHFAARLMFIAPLFYIVLAAGVHWLMAKREDRGGFWQRAWPKLLMGIMLLGWGIGLRNYFIQADFINANYIIPWQQIIADLQGVVDEEEVVVVLDEPSFKYYQDQFKMVFIEGDSREPIEETLAELLTLNPPRIWLVARDRSEVSMALTTKFERWLTENYALVSAKGYIEEDSTGLFYKEKIIGRDMSTHKVTIYEYHQQ